MKYDRGGRRNFGSQNFAPVKVGDELDVKIEAVGEKGDGIAKKNGFVLFVPSTKQGDGVRIRVTRVLQKVGFAEVVGEKSGEESAPERKTEEESHEETSEEEQSVDSEQYNAEDSDNFGEDTEDK